MANGESAFNDHVRHLGTPADRAEEVLDELERLLRQRMRRRGLLSAPPAYLGYSCPNWDTDDSFEDLLLECYSFSFARRMRGLKNRLGVHGDIRGVITRNVDNFLTDCQQRHDPIGYATFGNVEMVVQALVAAGRGQINPLRSTRIQNDSILVFAGGVGADVIAVGDLRTRLADCPGWAEALPALVVTSDEGQAWLLCVLDRCASDGVGAVRVGDLVAVVAARAREDWLSRHAAPGDEIAFEGDGELGQFVRLVAAASPGEDRDQWTWLKGEVARRIEESDNQERVRDRLASLFKALIERVERGEADAGAQADLVHALGFPKSTVSDAFRKLQEILEAMRPRN